MERNRIGQSLAVRLFDVYRATSCERYLSEQKVS